MALAIRKALPGMRLLIPLHLIRPCGARVLQRSQNAPELEQLQQHRALGQQQRSQGLGKIRKVRNPQSPKQLNPGPCKLYKAVSTMASGRSRASRRLGGAVDGTFSAARFLRKDK